LLKHLQTFLGAAQKPSFFRLFSQTSHILRQLKFDKGEFMDTLLRVSKWIDTMNTKIATAMQWAVLVAVILSTFNAVLRTFFSKTALFQHVSNILFESQFIFFGGIFLLTAAYTLKKDEHVRIDVLVARYSERTQVKLDIIGIIFFMFPVCALVLMLCFGFFMQSFISGEHSGNSPLLLWPTKILLPLGFFPLLLQGVSELIKRVAYLQGKMAFHAFRKAGHNPDDEVKAYIDAIQQK
jgi:TRAP-type mannitol/chloroaromatic compound transport system permease small subunit